MTELCATLRGRVGDRVVEFDAAEVRGVLLAPSVTEFPEGAPSLRGLFAWRERVVPLVSLAPERAGRVAVVLEARGELVAVELESVLGVEARAATSARVALDEVRALVAVTRQGAVEVL